ncbi:MAG: hypothetical protein Q8P80_05630 [Candidatus Levybacteria bacterium]|nr:hypothetical protein [Candidatus Levybacteria bacterium]
MEISTIDIKPSIERLLSTPTSRIEVNGYLSRGKINLVVNGEKEEWHSFKGGAREDAVNHQGDTYEVLAKLGHDSMPEKWLKLVPPTTTHYNKLRKTLQQSFISGKVALKIAGMRHLAREFQECIVVKSSGLEKKAVYGFTSPHLGRTVESFLKEKIPPEERKELLSFLADVYGIAYKHAATLFVREGVWMDDPNPGNILLHQSEDGIQVALIDFANERQGNPAQRGNLSDEELREKVYSNPGSLFNKFGKQCAKHQIPFSVESEPVLEIVTSPSIRAL